MKVPTALLVGINNFVKHVMGDDPDPIARKMRSLYLNMNKETLEMGELQHASIADLNAAYDTHGSGLQIKFKTSDGVEHIGVII
jgi:hypothetical protein